MTLAGGPLWFFAVPQEAEPVRRRLRGAWIPRIEVTGIGPRKAQAAALRALAQTRPTLVLTCGFAGGLNPSLRPGTVVYAADEGSSIATWLHAAAAVPGRFHCSDRILVTASEKAQVWRQTGADAVEMESGVIRSICRERGVPSATIRVISDAADEDLPLDFNGLSTPDFDLSYVRLALALARQPRKILALLRFQRELAAAASRLAEVLTASLAIEPKRP